MQSYLHITYEESPCEIVCDNYSFLKYRITPFCCSEVYNTSINNCDVLTDEESRKVYDLKFSLNITNNFNSGSTIGILPRNEETLVDQLMVRLGIENVCDNKYKLNILSDSKKNACVPKHIPERGTLRNVFLHHVDLKGIPKKMFLRCLQSFVDDEKEREELEFLCSPKGSNAYRELISSYSERSLLLLLNRFSSCHLPVENLLEHLPPLIPRVYSISSSPLNKDYFSITFNVDTFSDNQKGVCTSWLEKSILKYKTTKHSKVLLYFRIPSDFLLPKDNLIPIIMIATGTGIAPFKGFLEHRHLQIKSQSISFSEAWLFYGCRDSEQNYLYKKDLQAYLKSGALSRLFESFSRQTTQKCYVQHNIEQYGDQLTFLILEKAAIIYVCGDFIKVLPAVRNSILNSLIKCRNFTKEVAELYMRDLEKTHRYIVDNWN